LVDQVVLRSLGTLLGLYTLGLEVGLEGLGVPGLVRADDVVIPILSD